MATLGEFLGREEGQKRRKWLDETVGNTLSYFLGPTGIDDRLNAVAMVNPVNDVGEAMQNSRVMMDGSRSGRERFDAGVDMATNMAAVLAPVVAGKVAGGADEAADVVDALLGFGGPTREAATDYAKWFAADESGALFGGRTVDEVLGFTKSGRPFYHSGSADVAEDIHKWGVEPQTGEWVQEIMRGNVDDDMIDAVLDAPPAAWWADAPDWVRAKTARAAGKHVSEVTDDDIRQFGHLAIADADEWGESVYRVGEEGLSEGEYSRLTTLDGDTVKLYETPLYDHDTQGKYPFGVERSELITAETIEPRYSLTGDELVDFLQRYGGEPTDPATQRGQEVLDLLRNGRASEVTDEMLDLGDPTLNARLNEYLFRNYDLPMDEASRMARAREMGFDRDLYHGGDGLGSQTNFKFSSPPHFSYGPDGANAYALDRGGDEAEVGNYLIRSGNRASESQIEAAYEAAKGDKYDFTRDDMGRGYAWETLNPDYSDFTSQTHTELTDRGFDSAFFQDDFTPEGEEISSLAVLKPWEGTIRSRFARFDPRLSHLRNLSAGAAGLGILGGANMQNDDNQPLRAYLGL